MLLTVGANDIDFSGLVANVIIDATRERVLFGRSVISLGRSRPRARSTRKLPGNFAKLRAALKPMVGGDLSRVVFVSYGNPALRAGRLGLRRRTDAASTCIRRSRWIGERMRRVAEFVGARFLPVLKAHRAHAPATPAPIRPTA